MSVGWRGTAFRSIVAGAFVAVVVLANSAADAQTPEQIASCMNIGDLFPRDQQISACSVIIQANRRSGKDLLWALHHRAYAYYRSDKFDTAIVDFTEAIRINPADAHALNGRCWMRAILGRELREALDDCNESLRVRANDAPTLDSRAFTCLKLGQLNHAISDYDAALSIDPKQAESYFGRGVAKLKKGDKGGGNADIAAAKAIQADVEQEFAKYGIRLAEVAASGPPGPPTVDCARAVAQWTAPDGFKTFAERNGSRAPVAIVARVNLLAVR